MRLFVIVAVSVLVAVAECQYRRVKYREENYYERLYKRRMAEEEMQKFSQTAFQRRLGTAYISKFPIIPPRLRMAEKQDEKKLEKDDIDPSSTNLSPASVLWEHPRKHLNRTLDSPTTVAPPEKLMRPRPTRPQAYSLDGFVPKPSNIEISIQTPPISIASPKKFQSPSALKSVWGEAFLQKGGKKPKGKKEKEKLKKELLEKKFKTGSASNRRRTSKKGIPGVDYPVHVQIPESSFTCEDKKISGMYADKEAGCQVWHICTGVTKVAKVRHSFLCASGTIFSEKKGVCDWWYNVQC